MIYPDLLALCDPTVRGTLERRLPYAHLVGSEFYLCYTRPLVRVPAQEWPGLKEDLELRAFPVNELAPGVWEVEAGFGITICILEE